MRHGLSRPAAQCRGRARTPGRCAPARAKYAANHPDVKALEEKLKAASQPVEFICGDDAEALTREKGKW